ncbi:MAG: hypothetical protein FWH27_08035 [Planctomycetaceae bacterium]|nr:hypothetical protein [Planctomycetaceae bacterium]
MSDLPELHAELVELVYGLLTEERAGELRARIAGEPEVAELYEQVLQKASLIADASRVSTSTSLFSVGSEQWPVSLPQATCHRSLTTINRIMTYAALCLVVLTICGYAYQRYQLSRMAGILHRDVAVVPQLPVADLQPTLEVQISNMDHHLAESNDESLSSFDAMGKPSGSYSVRNAVAESQVRPLTIPLPQQPEQNQSQEDEAQETSEPALSGLAARTAPIPRNQSAANQNLPFPEHQMGQAYMQSRATPGSVPVPTAPQTPVPQSQVLQSEVAQGEMSFPGQQESDMQLLPSMAAPARSRVGGSSSDNMQGGRSDGDMGGGMGGGMGIMDVLSDNRDRASGDVSTGKSSVAMPDSERPKSGVMELNIAASVTPITQNDQTTWQIEIQVTDANGQAVADAQVAVQIVQLPAIPSAMVDNPTGLQNGYQQQIESIRHSQRTWSIVIGVVVFVSGVTLAVLSVILAIKRVASRPRMLVTATVSGLACVFVCVVMLRGQDAHDFDSLNQSAKSTDAMSKTQADGADISGIIVNSALRTDADGQTRVEPVLPANRESTYYLVIEAVAQDGQAGIFRSTVPNR